MTAWNGWPSNRASLLPLPVGVAFIVLGVQVSLLHWRPAFGATAMSTPVIAAPLIAAAAVVVAPRLQGVARSTFAYGDDPGCGRHDMPNRGSATAPCSRPSAR